MPDYRDDDQRDRGYCPKCGEPLTGLTRAARGYCEQHGWVWAEWTKPQPAGVFDMRRTLGRAPTVDEYRAERGR